eukprot:scaffold269583_cov26-Tisochrysis_lutea.AAC.1
MGEYQGRWVDANAGWLPAPGGSKRMAGGALSQQQTFGAAGWMEAQALDCLMQCTWFSMQGLAT